MVAVHRDEPGRGQVHVRQQRRSSSSGRPLIPLLAIVVVGSLSFHPGNFTAGGGFMPFGFHGVFAALPAGVVFALQGFEQGVQLAGEARNPQQGHVARDHHRDVIGALLYILLQAAFIGALDPDELVTAGPSPLGQAVGLRRLVHAGARGRRGLAGGHPDHRRGRLARGHRHRLHRHHGAAVLRARRGTRDAAALARDRPRGVPVWSIIVAAVVGWPLLRAVPELEQAGRVVTGATAIMYAFAPIALAALHQRDAERAAAVPMPCRSVLLPVAFCSANLIIYWGGFDVHLEAVTSRSSFGWLLFGVGAAARRTDVDADAAQFLVDPALARRHAGHRTARPVRRYGVPRRAARVVGPRRPSSCSAWPSSTWPSRLAVSAGEVRGRDRTRHGWPLWLASPSAVASAVGDQLRDPADALDQVVVAERVGQPGVARACRTPRPGTIATSASSRISAASSAEVCATWPRSGLPEQALDRRVDVERALGRRADDAGDVGQQADDELAAPVERRRASPRPPTGHRSPRPAPRPGRRSRRSRSRATAGSRPP